MHSATIRRASNVSYPDKTLFQTKLLAQFIRSALTLALLAPLVTAQPAESQESILYTFDPSSNGGSGAFAPLSGLIFDASGNLYGTSLEGGQYGSGTVFELCPESGGGCPGGSNIGNGWYETILYSFTGGSDGSCYVGSSAGGMCSSLIWDNEGNLYGTAPYGGIYGAGVVFELSPAGGGMWTEIPLYSFGGQDSFNPQGGVVMDNVGNLYGTTSSNYYQVDKPGVVFELNLSTTGWNETPIYSLQYAEVLNPGLAIDPAGNLYGTTTSNVFELSPNGQGSFNAPVSIHTFAGAPKDVSGPSGGSSAPLVFDAAGNLYGVADMGGAKNDGGVYKLSPKTDGKGWSEKVLYSFHTPAFCCPYYPASALVDASGNVYGTSGVGGTFGYGLAYELVPPADVVGGYKEKTLFSFNKIDGSTPFSSLVLDSAGNLYGTTSAGGWLGTGSGCGSGGGFGCGTVFELNPSATATTNELTSTPNPSTSGEAVTFTATVSPAPPDGESISFMEGSTALGTGPLSGGVATLSYAALPVGTAKITAVYQGDLAFVGSTSKALTQDVKK
jgi:uncharacterized repeat protein (TIGR03803 family)